MKKRLSFVILFAVMLFSSCTADNTEKETLYTFTDSLNRTVEVKSFDKTAVASGSLAEIWQLAGGELYGVTSNALEGHSLDLSDDVNIYGDVKNPSVENMISGSVDFVILSGSIANQVKLADTFDSSGMTAAYFDVENFEDYLSALKICTDITDRSDLYAQYGEAVRERVDAAIKRSQGRNAPKILLLRAYSTGIKAKGSDNMTGQMLSDLGCTNIADSESSLLEELSLEAIVRADPDFVFITTMGDDEEAAAAQYEEILGSNQAWQEITAVKNGKVYFLPKNMFHYKPNDRWGEAYEYLEEILYGEK